ncbi:putative cytochrome 52A4 [Aureobasidium subglaciale]|nr:putative cytochrome 52A4 [Aureobasidium subglaciale]
MSLGERALFLDPKVQFIYNGAAQVATPHSQQAPFEHDLNHFVSQYGLLDHQNASSQKIISTAIKTTTQTLFEQNFIPWKFHPRHSDFEPAINASCTYIKSVRLEQCGIDSANVTKPLAGGVDESYSLSIKTDGQVTITAASSVGIAHGLTTFTQLFYKHSSGSAYTPYAPVSITDAPKFQHRGLNMDVSRVWYAPADITRMIDALAYNKFNRLHLHITDAQSWPLEIPALPMLAEKGSYREGLTYSPSTMAFIQDYGASRGVEVILEIDMPGHTSSIAYSYPELIAAFNEKDWSTYAAEPPSGTLKLNSSAVTEFLDTLFDDLLPRVLPYASYFHTGGDEVNLNAYNLDDTVRSNDTAILQPLMQAFVDRAHAKVRAAGLTPIAWEEMLLTWNLTLGPDVVIQTWQSDEAVAQTVSKGHKALVGNYNYWYLDCGHGQWLDFYPDVSQSFYPYYDYCAPLHNWRMMYAYDPLEGVPANLTHLVLGGEVHIWSEQTDPVNVDRQVWPRACAAAEVLWSGAKDDQGQNRSQITASPRLSEMRERLVAKGIGAEPIQMPFSRIQEERKIRSLGAHANSVKSWVPFGLGFIGRTLLDVRKHDLLGGWQSTFADRSAVHPYTRETRTIGMRLILTADEENIKAILATQFNDYGKGAQFNSEWHDFLGDSIFTTDGEKWHASRQLIRPQFIKDRVSDLAVFEKHLEILLPMLGGSGDGKSVDAMDLFFKFTLDASTAFLLGHSVNSLVNSQDRFSDAFATVQSVQSTIARVGPLNRFVPRKAFYASLKIMEEFMQPFIEETLQLTPEELEKKSKSDEGYNFLYALASFTRDRTVLRDQLAAVLLAGRDTTACTLSWLFNEISRRPDIVAKLRREIEENVGLDNKPTYTHLKNMRYLTHTINETLRLYPIVPFNVRVALKDTTLPRGGGPDGTQPIGVPANTPIAYSTLFLQRREDIYPKASEKFAHHLSFEPDRWDGWNPKMWTYIPFNGGPRICIGQQFALTEVAYTVVRILQTYSRIECKMAERPKLKTDIVVQPSDPVNLIFHRD